MWSVALNLVFLQIHKTAKELFFLFFSFSRMTQSESHKIYDQEILFKGPENAVTCGKFSKTIGNSCSVICFCYLLTYRVTHKLQRKTIAEILWPTLTSYSFPAHLLLMPFGLVVMTRFISSIHTVEQNLITWFISSIHKCYVSVITIGFCVFSQIWQV